MYNPQLLSPATTEWVMNNALNELNAFLSDGDFYEQYGKDWPGDARTISTYCRDVAKAALSDSTRQAWLDLADQYEDTISLAGKR
jgi:hypothetical protein